MTEDFRLHRYKLPPDAFAIGPEKDAQPAMACSKGLANTTPNPSRASASTGARATSGLSSCARMNPTKRAERRNDRASNRIASGAEIAWITTPAMPGPASCAVERLASSLLFPSTRTGRRRRKTP